MQALLPFPTKENEERTEPVKEEIEKKLVEKIIVEPDLVDDEPLFEEEYFDEEGQLKLFTALLQQAINDYLKDSRAFNECVDDIDRAGKDLITHCIRFYQKDDIPNQLLKFLRSLPEYNACSWFLSSYEGPYSYRWICKQFEPAVDPDFLLEKIMSMPKSNGGLTLNTKKLYIRSSRDPSSKKRRRRRKPNKEDSPNGADERRAETHT